MNIVPFGFSKDQLLNNLCLGTVPHHHYQVNLVIHFGAKKSI